MVRLARRCSCIISRRTLSSRSSLPSATVGTRARRRSSVAPLQTDRAHATGNARCKQGQQLCILLIKRGDMGEGVTYVGRCRISASNCSALIWPRMGWQPGLKTEYADRPPRRSPRLRAMSAKRLITKKSWKAAGSNRAAAAAAHTQTSRPTCLGTFIMSRCRIKTVRNRDFPGSFRGDFQCADF